MATRVVPFSTFDQLADRFFGSPSPFGSARVDRQIPVDAVVRDDALLLSFDLPGIAQDDVELTIERRTLTVKVERPYGPQEGDRVLLAERPWGRMSRQVSLSDTLDLDQAAAHFDKGVLTVRIPMSDRAKSRRIEITHAPVDAASIPVETTN